MIINTYYKYDEYTHRKNKSNLVTNTALDIS